LLCISVTAGPKGLDSHISDSLKGSGCTGSAAGGLVELFRLPECPILLRTSELKTTKPSWSLVYCREYKPYILKLGLWGIFFLFYVWRSTAGKKKILGTRSSSFKNKVSGNPQVSPCILFLCINSPTFLPGFLTTAALGVLSSLEGGSDLNQNKPGI